ncbi:MAG: pilus assembly protein N-terminal domain-containing protein [Gammaproteobacteria bacterium]|nr:pilus assembly protein N-terminal domain-containing protein [Gammaproteobacteria bacterium]
MAWLAAMALAPLDALAATGARIQLAPGDSRQLTFDRDVGLVIVTDPEVADITVEGVREINLFARGIGAAKLTVRATDGAALLEADILVDATPNPVRAVIRDIAGPETEISVIYRGEALFVSGQAASPAEAARVLRAVRAVVDEGVEVIDDLVLARPPQINLEVLISEVSRNVSNSLGVDWTIARRHARTPVTVAFANGALVSQALLEGDAATAVAQDAVVLSAERTFRWGNSTIEVDAFLEALAGSGLGVVHAKPNLTAVSGETASFFAGLEIPVPTVSGTGNVTTEFRETGVSLDFTPVVLDENTISLRVEPTIREIVAGVTIIAGAAIPNINERSVSTTVELADGESMAIAGMYRRNRNRVESGIPMLKDIPLWGALFRDLTMDDDTIELIVVVTPRIVSALPAAVAAAAQTPGGGVRRLDEVYYY